MKIITNILDFLLISRIFFVYLVCIIKRKDYDSIKKIISFPIGICNINNSERDWNFRWCVFKK